MNDMFCKNCGNEIKDGMNFCDKCGVSTINNDSQQNKSIIYNQKGETRYASTAFKFALFGIVCWLCCGFQLLAGFPAILFGGLAIKNKEAEKEKAYIAIGIGVLDIIIFIILMSMGIRE